MAMPVLIDTNGQPLRRASVTPSPYSAAYQAADMTAQDLMGWAPGLGSADSDLLPERRAMVARFRDIARNDAWLGGALRREIDIVIGGELRLQATPDWRALGITREQAAEVAQQIEAEYRRFSGDQLRRFDLARRLTMGQRDRLAYHHWQLDGEILDIAHWRPERGGRYATCFQLIDPDRLSNPMSQPDTRDMRAGVELDEDGVPVAYHIERAHPADPWPDARQLEWERVEAETGWGRPQVIHMFDVERSDQTRGKPEASVIKAVKMLQHYSNMEMQAAVVNAVFAAFIESPFDQDLITQRLGMQQVSAYQDMRRQFHEERNYSLAGVRIPRLFPGEKFNFSAAARPAGGFGPFMETFLRYIAAGTGQTYMQVAQDWSKANYSSARAALLDVWRTIWAKRTLFCTRYKGPQLLCFLEEAIDRGYVTLPAGAPGFYEAPEAWARCRWIGPGRGYVDPTKEATAAEMRLANNTSTLEAECADQGLDWEEVLEQRAREQARMHTLGLQPVPFPAARHADSREEGEDSTPEGQHE